MLNNEVANSLNQIFKSSILLLFGVALGGLLTLGLHVIVARFYTPDLFGVFSQAIGVLYILVMISMLGLNAGISRYISYHESEEKIYSAVGSSLIVVIPFSVLIFATLFFLSDQISVLIFEDDRISEILRVFSIAGPAMAANSIIISGFRGFKSTKERFLILDFIIPLVQVISVLIVALIGLELIGVAFGYILAFFIAFSILVLWYKKSFSFMVKKNVFKQLIIFSWPLMISATAVQLFLWLPPLLVGFFSTSNEVGLFNSALPLASSTKIILSSAAFLFMPVISTVYSARNLGEIKKIQEATTRWILNISLPLLGFFFIFSSESISFIFGDAYVDAGLALSALIAGYIFNVVTGPLGELLIATGDTKKEAFSNLLKLSSFLLLSLLLVPRIGFLGAAVSYSIGMIVGNLSRYFFSWKYVGFFYNRNYIKPFIAFAASTLIVFLLPHQILILTASAFIISYIIIIVILKPFEKYERKIISHYLEKFNLYKNDILKPILKYFKLD